MLADSVVRAASRPSEGHMPGYTTLRLLRATRHRSLALRCGQELHYSEGAKPHLSGNVSGVALLGWLRRQSPINFRLNTGRLALK